MSDFKIVKDNDKTLKQFFERFYCIPKESDFTKEEIEIIKNDIGSYREKAKKYNISIGTISKIMNDKY